MKTQTRIAFVLFLSYVFIIFIFGGAIYYFLNKYSYQDFYKRLETRASIASKYYLDSNRLNSQALKAVREQHLEKLSEEKEFLLEIEGDTSLNRLSKSNSIPLTFLKDIYYKNRATLKTGNTFYAGIKHDAQGRVHIVIVSAENYYASHHLSFLKTILWIGISLIVLITISLSVYFSKRVFNPIKQIAQKVKQISTENMHLRLEEAQSRDEITELVATFNDLLNRMETAFETQKNFISNASHEFGTPLTTIMGEAEVTLAKERTPADYKEALQNILQQAERLDKITKSLLFLAQTGYKGKKITFEILRVDEIVWEVKALMDDLNPENQIQVDLSLLPDDPKKLKVNGNRELLQLAIANLLNNACKYSQNKPVAVGLAAGSNRVILLIKDQGIGIPESELPFIYDPFFRASNTAFYEGYGIGLPLSRNIVKLHNGHIEVSSVAGKGTTVQIDLPLAIVNLPAHNYKETPGI